MTTCSSCFNKCSECFELLFPDLQKDINKHKHCLCSKWWWLEYFKYIKAAKHLSTHQVHWDMFFKRSSCWKAHFTVHAPKTLIPRSISQLLLCRRTPQSWCLLTGSLNLCASSYCLATHHFQNSSNMCSGTLAFQRSMWVATVFNSCAIRGFMEKLRVSLNLIFDLISF